MLDEILDDGFLRENITEEEKKQINLQKIQINAAIPDLKVGRTTFYAMAGLVVLGVILGFAMNPYDASAMEILIEGVFLIGIYFGCGYFLPLYPKPLIITGISVYIIMILLGAMIDPSTLAKGILIKGLILYYLFKALGAVFSYQNAFNKLKSLGLPEEELRKLKNLEEVKRTV